MLILQLPISNARIFKLHGFCQVIDVVAEKKKIEVKKKSTTSVKQKNETSEHARQHKMFSPFKRHLQWKKGTKI